MHLNCSGTQVVRRKYIGQIKVTAPATGAARDSSPCDFFTLWSDVHKSISLNHHAQITILVISPERP